METWEALSEQLRIDILNSVQQQLQEWSTAQSTVRCQLASPRGTDCGLVHMIQCSSKARTVHTGYVLSHSTVMAHRIPCTVYPQLLMHCLIYRLLHPFFALLGFHSIHPLADQVPCRVSPRPDRFFGDRCCCMQQWVIEYVSHLPERRVTSPSVSKRPSL